MNKLFRTTLVVWTKNDPKDLSVEQIVEEGYVSYRNSRETNDPQLDPHCDFSQYFDEYNRNS